MIHTQVILLEAKQITNAAHTFVRYYTYKGYSNAIYKILLPVVQLARVTAPHSRSEKGLELRHYYLSTGNCSLLLHWCCTFQVNPYDRIATLSLRLNHQWKENAFGSCLSTYPLSLSLPVKDPFCV